MLSGDLPCRQVMPTISVVISTYNRQRFIGEAIESVLNQSYPPLEIIVVDDGSTDGTERTVRSFDGKIPIHYHWQPNRGQASSLNLGVSLAKGDWIAFHDSDDIWYTHKLAVQVCHLQNHPDVSFFYSNMDYCLLDETGGTTAVSRRFHSALVPLMFNGLPNVHVPTVLVRRDVLRQVGGFNQGLRIGESWELFTRIALAYQLHHIPECLAKQRYHPGQITRNMPIKVDTYRHFHKAMMSIWKNEPLKQKILVSDTEKIYKDLGTYFAQRRDYGKARRCFGLAWSYRPTGWSNLRRCLMSLIPGVRDRYWAAKFGGRLHNH
jgi:glycosyltransferase involved in cell wall biosynthesis